MKSTFLPTLPKLDKKEEFCQLRLSAGIKTGVGLALLIGTGLAPAKYRDTFGLACAGMAGLYFVVTGCWDWSDAHEKFKLSKLH